VLFFVSTSSFPTGGNLSSTSGRLSLRPGLQAAHLLFPLYIQLNAGINQFGASFAFSLV